MDQRFGFGREPRCSRDMPQFGKICAMEYATKAGLCRRLSRRVNMIARKNPVKAPRNASVIERLLKVRSPWPARRNQVYAMATVQRITRTENMGDHLLMSKYIATIRPCGVRVSAVYRQDGQLDTSYSRLLDPSSGPGQRVIYRFFNSWKVQEHPFRPTMR